MNGFMRKNQSSLQFDAFIIIMINFNINNFFLIDIHYTFTTYHIYKINKKNQKNQFLL